MAMVGRTSRWSHERLRLTTLTTDQPTGTDKMKKVIRLGDPTSHGGAVMTAAQNLTALGIAVARKGDKCTCPIAGHGVCTIVEGDPDWTIDGMPVALEGHQTSCGATLISTIAATGRG